MLPLHIKLGLVNIVIKSKYKFGYIWINKHIQYLFPKINATKINEETFIEPDIRKLISDSYFVRKLNKLEQFHLLSIITDVTRSFLGNKIYVNYRDIIKITSRTSKLWDVTCP